ncbi:hypothetical protein [Rhizobium sp. AN80A]|uniref:hypothetical protein n=1 Tax=Rhizobium sp. AN80A TaxID=3040673 RepID=UPI0024B343AB|nr:hypothetical protein [Rhizobium sp. AN80A]
MLKRIDDCRIRWLIRTKQGCGLQPEHDVFPTLTTINFRNAAFCFVNVVADGPREPVRTASIARGVLMKTRGWLIFKEWKAGWRLPSTCLGFEVDPDL